jgi:ketosteroid isomerase-like protein
MNNSDHNDDIRQTILAIGREIYAAIQRKDADSLERFLANDFVHRGADGTEAAKEEFLRGIREMPFEINSVKGQHEKVFVYGNVAVMTGVQHAEWRQSEAAHGLNSVAFVDVFTLRDDRWLLVLAYGVELQS